MSELSADEVAKRFNALYPQELVERYESGERDFVGINLLREELEHIFELRQAPPRPRDQPVPLEDDWGPEWSEPLLWYSNGFVAAVNPLWADYRDFEPEFEWDHYGTFIPTEYDDLLPPRELAGLDLRGINLT